MRPAGSDLGGEDGLPGLGDHVELLDGGGQVTGRSQVSQTHEATLGPDVVVRPVVPFIWSVRGWRRNNGGMFWCTAFVCVTFRKYLLMFSELCSFMELF